MSRHYLLPVGLFFAVFGIFLFTKGLLTSKPLSDSKSDASSSYFKPPFSLESKTGPIVIVVIDALRIDFCLEPKHPENIPMFSNKLKILYEMAKDHPNNAKLFEFIADPPTATTQRLAGITAGSLPSFVEAFANFAGDTLTADNIIYQMLNDTRYSNLNLLGDDTWLHLFPFITQKSTGVIKGYHSFHLFDLHSVDTGIKSHLFPILEDRKYDVIIAHFLGLDHCGHKFGPYHAQCAEKLSELDGVIRKIIRALPSDAELFIFGDHGMTDEGDHGGDSPKEVTSALFHYSNRTSNVNTSMFQGLVNEIGRVRFQDQKQVSFFANDFMTDVLSGAVSQTDFAPTLSHTAGLPMPFSNLGSIIPELFFNRHDNTMNCFKDLLNGLYMNGHQTLNYFQSLSSYDPEFRQFSHIIDDADILLSKLTLNDRNEEETIKQLQDIVLLYYKYLHLSSSHCRKIWASYGYINLLLGIVFLVIAAVALTARLCIEWDPKLSISFPLMCVIVSRYLAKFTNSFIIYEAAILTFTLTSILVYHYIFADNRPYLLILTVILRALKLFFTCREEHGKSCITFGHRSVKPNSLQGALILSLAILGSFKSLKRPRLSSMAYLGLLMYQFYCWARETMDIEDNIFQIYLSRLIMILNLCICGLSFSSSDSHGIKESIRSLLSLMQRPFGGWLLANVAPFVETMSESFSNDHFLYAIFLFFYEMLIFFWTGHQAEIGSIHWEVGFVGWTSLNQIRATFFILLNIMAGPLHSTFISRRHPNILLILTVLCIWELVFEVISISLLLRHLMLWSVFTPRFLLQILLVVVKLAFLIGSPLFWRQ